ncbi:MAG TPA: cell envelope integrity protein TolA [Gammaproteobacteria bacterium]|jgi:colicin import membrane protein|nr:cell envelope integrity protein TolA [Gammaproteobacteria bacterium]
MITAKQQRNRCFVFSALAHALIFFALVMGFDFSSPLPVLENTNKNDIISAVVLGDSPKSNILPQQPPPTPPKPVTPPPKEIPKVAPKPAPAPIQKDTIALEKAKKKKQQEAMMGDLLADIKKQAQKKKKVQQKQLQSKFASTLREQAEKSMRQQLLDEDLLLKGTQSRQAQGEVNKYKALILQAISEQWLVPTQANKKLYCELMIRLAPGGMVLDVQVTKTSGDPALDSSARAAVLKASPLPVPKEGSAFEAFRQFVLKVKPENVIEG